MLQLCEEDVSEGAASDAVGYIETAPFYGLPVAVDLLEGLDDLLFVLQLFLRFLLLDERFNSPVLGRLALIRGMLADFLSLFGYGLRHRPFAFFFGAADVIDSAHAVSGVKYYAYMLKTSQTKAQRQMLLLVIVGYFTGVMHQGGRRRSARSRSRGFRWHPRARVGFRG